MCLFYAIKRKDRVGVRSLLASGEDANSRQGIEGCLPGPGEPGYGSEPDPVQIESAWCMAARDKRPLDVAIQSKDPMIVKMLQVAGGLTGKRPNVGERAVGFPYRWARLMEPLNRTAYDNGTGAFGYIYEMLPQKISGGMVTGNASG